MQKSKELLKAAGVLPKLRLAIQKTDDKGKKLGVESTGPHRVKLLEDKIVPGIDKQTGKKIEEVLYLLEENGEKKEYRVPVKDRNTGQLHYLVQRLAEVPPEGEVILHCKKAGIKNYIEVIPVNEIGKVEYEEESDRDEDPDNLEQPPEEYAGN